MTFDQTPNHCEFIAIFKCHFGLFSDCGGELPFERSDAGTAPPCC